MTPSPEKNHLLLELSVREEDLNEGFDISYFQKIGTSLSSLQATYNNMTDGPERNSIKIRMVKKLLCFAPFWTPNTYNPYSCGSNPIQAAQRLTQTIPNGIEKEAILSQMKTVTLKQDAVIFLTLDAIRKISDGSKKTLFLSLIQSTCLGNQDYISKFIEIVKAMPTSGEKDKILKGIVMEDTNLIPNAAELMTPDSYEKKFVIDMTKNEKKRSKG